MATDDDDVILIPRRLHSTADSRDSNGKQADCTIDPAMLERHSARKKKLSVRRPQIAPSIMGIAASSSRRIQPGLHSIQKFLSFRLFVDPG